MQRKRHVTLRKNNTISLRRVVNGQISVLASAPFTVATGTPYRIRLEAIGDRLRVYVDSRLLLEAADTGPTRNGRSGLVMFKAAARFDDVRISEP